MLAELDRWWADQAGELPPRAEFKSDHLHLHQDIGSVSFQGIDRDGSIVVQGMVSCPRWYYCNNLALTCLLPPEASKHLSEAMGPGYSGLCPDLIMNPTDGGAARAKAKEAIETLYERARREGMARY